MTASSQARTYQDYVSELEVYEGDLDIPVIQSARKKAYVRFKELGFPTNNLEAWKHTKLDRILKQPFEPSSESVKVDDPQVFDRYHLPKDGEHRATYLNGVYSKRFSLSSELPKGVVLGGLLSHAQNNADKIDGYLEKGIELEENAFACINTFSFKEGVFLYVPDRVTIDIPIHIVFAGLGSSSKAPAFFPRTLIVLGNDAKVNLVTSYLSLNNEPYLMNAFTQVHLGRGAKLNWTKVQRLNDHAAKVLTTRCYQRVSSNLEMVAFNRGGQVSHNDFQTFFEGEGASFKADGLAVLSRKSQVTQVVTAHHQSSGCISRQIFKNILADESQSEFNSLAYVYKGTKGSDTHQLNRNLILSKNARAYARPQLKIDADDVSAAHGSATGQLDERELFYLRSRGFSRELAKFILTYGFAEEILEKIPSDNVRWQLELHIRKEIEAMIRQSEK